MAFSQDIAHAKLGKSEKGRLYRVWRDKESQGAVYMDQYFRKKFYISHCYTVQQLFMFYGDASHLGSFSDASIY